MDGVVKSVNFVYQHPNTVTDDNDMFDLTDIHTAQLDAKCLKKFNPLTQKNLVT